MFVAVFRILFYASGKINRCVSLVRLLVEELLPAVQSTGLGSGGEFEDKLFSRVHCFTLAAGCKVLSSFISHLPQYALHVTDKLVDIPDIENDLIV